MTGPSWQPPEGAAEQQPTSAEYWKPMKPGEAVVGLLAEYGESHFGPFARLNPVVHYPVGAKAQGYRELRIGINTWLEKLLGPRILQRGTPIGVRFDGSQMTPQGNMRTYSVFRLSDEAWETEKAQHLSHDPDAPTPF